MNKTKYVDRLQKDKTVKVLLNILRLSDEEAYTHSLSVATITEEFLNLMPDSEWTETQKEEIVTGALLHDIGKAFLPFHIQSCSMSLKNIELQIIQTHTNLGYSIISEIFPEIVSDIVLLHHERADGSGYPIIYDEGPIVFTEENIPDYVALVSYADILDALITEKSYRRGHSLAEAWKIIESEIDSQKLTYKFKNILFQFVQNNGMF